MSDQSANGINHFLEAKKHVEQAQQEVWGGGDPINDINQALAHLRAYERSPPTETDQGRDGE